MTDEPTPTGPESEPIDELTEEAEDLIGTDAVWRGQILYAGAELGVFDLLGSDPKDASDIARELELHQDRAYRLLRALAHFGVLREDDHRRFALTSLGKLFQNDHPHSVQSEVLFNRSPQWLRSMLHLPAVVSDGGPPGFVREYGIGFFEYAAADPDLANTYNELMELASREHPELFLDALNGYDFSQFSVVCDVGGGRGHFLSHLLEAIPEIEGVVFDQPSVVADTDQRWASNLGVATRCRYLGGDMFEEVPQADCYILKWILHNWNDEDCHQILSNIHERAPPEGRLLVLETLVPGPSTSHYAKRLDVTMMTQVGGRERTKQEYSTLLDQAGWHLGATHDTGDESLHILEAVKTETR